MIYIILAHTPPCMIHNQIIIKIPHHAPVSKIFILHAYLLLYKTVYLYFYSVAEHIIVMSTHRC